MHISHEINHSFIYAEPFSVEHYIKATQYLFQFMVVAGEV